MSASKPFIIPKRLVYEAWKNVKANAGSAGVDNETIDDFESDLKNNLYRIWNRMSSGSYFPPPVKAVAIPKKNGTNIFASTTGEEHAEKSDDPGIEFSQVYLSQKNGGERILGIPTVADRVAQMTVKMVLEPTVEPIFLPDSYGYRPAKSALDAIGITRKRCWEYDWVLEFDIKGLFDNIDHTLLLRALEKHTECRWVRLYVERWLNAPLQKADGTLVERTKGTPQGGVVSPVLANLFLHYTFDVWMTRMFPEVLWCRYADDGLVHCKTEIEAQTIKSALQLRLTKCGLEMHPEKTQIVYCKDAKRRGKYPNTKFDFLGYTFRRRGVKNPKDGKLFVGFNPAVSAKVLKSMREKTRKLNFRNLAALSLQDISRLYNPVLRGWMAYCGRFYPSGLAPMFRHFNLTLVAWVMRKYKTFRRRKTQASLFLREIAEKQPNLFVHWQQGKMGTFV